MSAQNKVSETVVGSHRKMPLDARIISWAVFVAASISILFGGLLLSGFSRIPSGYCRLALFGTLSLASKLSFGVYLCCSGLVALGCACGVARGYKFGWWLMLIYSINNIFDGQLIFSRHTVVASIGICISLGIITWLVYRRRLYGIGRNPEKFE